jgi:hypothetical protein
LPWSKIKHLFCNLLVVKKSYVDLDNLKFIKEMFYKSEIFDNYLWIESPLGIGNNNLSMDSYDRQKYLHDHIAAINLLLEKQIFDFNEGVSS